MRTDPSTPGRQRSPAYTSKIIKAGALIADTKALLSHWDLESSVAENLARVQQDNLFGKASRSRVADILAIFRQRYLADESVTKSLVTLIERKLPSASLVAILFYLTAKADPLLHDTVVEILAPLRERGVVEINVKAFQRELTKWVEEGKTAGRWSEPTLARVSQGLLSTLRDFGVLQGAVNKELAPSFLPPAAFAYVAFCLKQTQPSGAKLVELPDWKLFFLTREGVEKALFEAHQQGLLEYHVAGSVTRLTFPAASLEEYARVLT